MQAPVVCHGAPTEAASSRWGRPEIKVALTLGGIVFLFSLLLGKFADSGLARTHLGAEYFHIARALADGRGFSDPFGEATGPTAWVPPVFPALIAGLLLLFKSKSLAAGCVVCLTNLALVWIGTSIFAIVRRHCQKIPPAFAAFVFATWILTFNFWFLVLTNDCVLIALSVHFMVLAVVQAIYYGTVQPWRWGILGGLSALTSPAVGFTWGCMTLLFFLRGPGRRSSWIAAGVIAAALVAPWTARNYITFQQFVPVKSNLAYEAYQANVIDADGVYDMTTTEQHPYSQPDMRFRYAQLGELAFVAQHKRILLDRWNTTHFIHRVFNRAVAATVLHMPMYKGADSPVVALFKLLIYPIPFLSLLLGLALAGPHRKLLRVLALAFAAYICPYVMVAFYVRYLWPMFPVLMLFICFGVDQLLLYRAKRSGPGSVVLESLG